MTGPAPFRADLAEGPEGAEAVWLRARDGVRLRAVRWPSPGRRGTVFLLTGRTEAAEKYGRVARDIVASGRDLVTVDWRGQGFSDRLLPDARIGHVLRFADYQGDLAALLAHADARALPRPWHMLAHSMGGAIGLRALLGAHPFASAAFSAPMWGLAIAPSLRGVAKALPRLAQRIGLGHRVTPTTATETYFLVAPFAANLLTTDREHWDYMVRMARAEDRLRLGGPSLSWLAGALEETRALRAAPRPRLPAHAAVGEMEKIVDPEAVRAGMADWPGGSFAEMPLAEHELLMEAPAIRARFLDRVLALYASVEGGPSRQGRSTA